MNHAFYQHLFEKHQKVEPIPPNKEIASWARQLLQLLYPQQVKRDFKNIRQIEETFTASQNELLRILNNTKACEDCNNKEVVKTFFAKVPSLYQSLHKDAEAIVKGDPAAISEVEVIRTYPGFCAISFYRIAHELLHLDIPLIPRILTEYAHSKTGIDIHPGAEIGEYFFIDHGTGIVIGETSKIGNNVKLYQGVNLGALSVNKNMQSEKRHPTVEDGVVIYSGATILGGKTVLGHHSIIGGNVWLVKSVPAHSKVFHKPTTEVTQNQH